MRKIPKVFLMPLLYLNVIHYKEDILTIHLKDPASHAGGLKTSRPGGSWLSGDPPMKPKHTPSNTKQTGWLWEHTETFPRPLVFFSLPPIPRLISFSPGREKNNNIGTETERSG